MTAKIDLLYLDRQGSLPEWSLGAVQVTAPDPISVRNTLDRMLLQTEADCILFWDSSLGAPAAEKIIEAASLPGNVWHAGLRLGTSGQPDLIDFVWPDWMLNRDPDPEIIATSWRISLRACLMQVEVLHQMGSLHPEFMTLDGAALELGHRLITRGVITRHVPWLAPGSRERPVIKVPLEDKLRLILYRAGRFWLLWTLVRIFVTGLAPRLPSVKAGRNLLSDKERPAVTNRYVHPECNVKDISEKNTVSLLIPTVDRYPYLKTLLSQIGKLNCKPADVVVIDQTSVENRNKDLYREFENLPLKVLFLDEPGQCSSRNKGIGKCTGSYILFLDDDDEIGTTLIEDHLKVIRQFNADISCGVFDEKDRGPLPENFTFTRASDVFPAGNSLVSKNSFQDTGLFDLAYDKGARADGDLGMRFYLQGKLMVLNPKNTVFHHRAPAGGLRKSRARTVTYAGSRKKIFQRHLPSATELYLVLRHFSPRQVKEMIWQRVFGTFRIRGRTFKRMSKILIGILQLPHTLFVIRKRYAEARSLLKDFPAIPALITPRTEGESRIR